MRRESLAVVLGALFLGRLAAAQTDDGIVVPHALDAPQAPYPTGARGNAEVVFELEIAEDGSVTRATAREGVEPFVEAGRGAVLGWRFEPAKRDGIPVRSRVLARVEFREPARAGPSDAERRPSSPPAARRPHSSRTAGESASSEQPNGTAASEPVEVTVVGEREELGSIHVPKHEARLIPGAFSDPFRVVEVLPGVAPILSGLPYFFVRGAPPGDVGYFIDGIRVPILFHVGAGPSVIAPALVDRVDLFPSAYPARFGRAVGGVMAGETQAPSTAPRGEAQARVFDAALMAEQPFADGAGSVLVGARYSYTQALLALVAPQYELGYGDYQGRVSYAVNSQDRLSVFAFGSYDRLRDAEIDHTLFDVSFHRVDLRWDRTGEKGRMRLAMTLASDRVLNAEEDADVAPATLETDGIRGRLEGEHRVTPELLVRGGTDFGAERVGAEQEGRGGAAREFDARTDFSGGIWTDAVLRPGRRIELVPGMRVDVARSRDHDVLFLEPRLATRVQVAYGVAWITAFGLAHQLPTQVVHVPGVQPEDQELSEQEAWQASQGAEFALPESMLGRATLFHSWIDARSVDASMRNYGFELFLRRHFTERLGGFASYTLSWADQRFGAETRPAPFDRRHVVSAVLGYDLGKGFRIGTRGYFASGRYYRVDCATPDCGPGDPEGPRPFVQSGLLPDFFRLDLRFEKRWRFASGIWLAATFEWFNALLAEETTGIEWDAERGGLRLETRSPLTLPSIGIEAGF